MLYLLKQMLRFSFAFFPAAVFFVLIEMSDRWILGYLLGVNEVGLYGAGYKIGSIILLLVNSFNLNWQPYYLKHEKTNIFLIYHPQTYMFKTITSETCFCNLFFDIMATRK